MLRKFFKHEKGITGLETAIILIAFVVVAAVFAYTALSAGLFSTQKSQEAVYAGLKEAQSTLELRGGIIATANTTGDTGTIKQVTFTVSSALGGTDTESTIADRITALQTALADTTQTVKFTLIASVSCASVTTA